MKKTISLITLLLLTTATAWGYSWNNYTIEIMVSGLVFPEGPVWLSEGYLVFSDVHAKTIEQLKPEGGTIPWLSKNIKTNGLILSRDKKKIFACGHSVKALLEIDIATRTLKTLASDYKGVPFLNVNDIALDRRGNIYFTDPDWTGNPKDIQGVYCYSSKGTLTRAVELNQQPNGIVVSPNGRWLYVARSGLHAIWRFQIHSNGSLSKGTCWVQLEKGAVPDGMTVDSRGNLFIAQAGNGKLCIVSPNGKIQKTISLPAKMPTNCEFSGKDKKVLFITTAGPEKDKVGTILRLTFQP